MALVNFIFSLIAIGFSLLALYKVGGIKDLKDKTADALENVQKALRTDEEEKDKKGKKDK